MTVSNRPEILCHRANPTAASRPVWLLLLFVPLASAQLAPTYLIKDIYPGPNGSHPAFTDLDGKLLFSAIDPTHGTELWTSDGTNAATLQLTNISPGVSDGVRYGVEATAGGKAFFQADDSSFGNELWVSDTVNPPLRLTDLAPGSGDTDFRYIVAEQDRVYFQLNGGTSLYQSDGTVVGTLLTQAGAPCSVNTGSPLPYFGSIICDGPGSGQSLVRTNGTTAGTQTLIDVPAGPGTPGIQSLVRARNRLYFNLSEASVGREPYVSDGIPGATHTLLLKDINSGIVDSNAYQFKRADGQVLFVAKDVANGYALWKTDGTPAGTSLVKDILPGAAADTVPVLLGEIDGVMLLCADDGVHGTELWRSDGTPGGTTLVKDINPGPNGSSCFTYWGKPDERIVFLADDGVHGREPWVSDGTPAGTKLLSDSRPGSFGLDPQQSHAFTNGRVLFTDLGVSTSVGAEPFAIRLMRNTPKLWCTQPGRSIPDNAPANPEESVVLFPDEGPITATSLRVDIDHTYVGDLALSLQHVETGTSVSVAQVTSGCSGDDMDISFSDAAPTPLSTSCNTTPAWPRYSTWKPQQPLSAFNGESSSGHWRLAMQDRANLDVGTLEEWCIQFSTDRIFGDRFQFD